MIVIAFGDVLLDERNSVVDGLFSRGKSVIRLVFEFAVLLLLLLDAVHLQNLAGVHEHSLGFVGVARINEWQRELAYRVDRIL